jgi:hypothetical protein
MKYFFEEMSALLTGLLLLIERWNNLVHCETIATEVRSRKRVLRFHVENSENKS